MLLVWCSVAPAQSGDALPASNGEKTANPQPAVDAEGQPSETREAARVEESRPAVYYLPDKQGNLQPVLDFKYQDFVDLYKLKNRLERRDEPPRYSVQRMTATGTVADSCVELSVQLQVLVRDDDWVRIPLRFDQGLLRGAIQYQGEGDHFVHYEDDGEGYVCWVRGKPDAQHEITMNMLVPISIVADETRLRLFTPRATASELNLTVPLANAIGKVSEGATLLPATAGAGNTTVLSVVGLGGDFSLTWHKATPRIAETPAVLEAVGSVLTRLDGRSIAAEATLSVRSYGSPFDRFTVRLPPGAELAAGNPNGYIVTPVETKEKSDQQQVEVRLPKKTAGPVEIRLASRRLYDPIKSQAWCELAGFEVVGAARQWGVTAVAAGGDWQVLWGVSSDVRQTDQLPDALRKTDVVAGFEYSTQPYLLSARLVPRKTRVGVDPKYVVLVDRDEVRLEGKLTCTIRGAKIATLDIAMPGWELDEVGPDNLVAIDGITQTAGSVAIPLVQPSSGTMEVLLRAHRTIPPDSKTLAIPLPQPQAASIGPASVAIVAADNVDLTPNSQAIEGLVRQRVAPPMKLPERQQDPLYYRGTGGAAVFAADFRVFSQRIAVDVATQATLDDRLADVEQRLSYSIAYEPVDRLSIAVPRELATAKRIQVLYDGKLLDAVAASDDLVGADPAAPVSLHVTLPGPRVGACELLLQYTVPVTEPTPQRSSTLSLPLPMPEDGKITTNSLLVKSSRNARVSLRRGPWTAAEREAASNGQTALRLTTNTAAARADFDLRWETDDTAGATIVDRAWVQSWLTSVARQDRAAYQLTTSRKDLEVILPTDAVLDQALVDGKRVERRALDDDRWAIPLPSQRETQRFVVELRYHFPDARPLHGTLEIEFPQIGPESWVRRIYWQLVLPANEHLITSPNGFTNEFAWGWQDYFWGRQPLLDQEQLESWIGAVPRDPLPERANTYLFSALGNAKSAEIRTAGRTLIVLCASGAALIVGLLLIYVPASRHPATLLVLSVALLAAGVIAPEPTLLLAQAASLGLVLALLAGFLERGVNRQRHRTTTRKEPSHARVELGSTRTPHHLPPGNSHASTDAMPAVQPQATGNADR